MEIDTNESHCSAGAGLAHIGPRIGAMHTRSGVCETCGKDCSRLNVWTHREDVGVKYAPRSCIVLIDVRLCPDCWRAAVHQAEAASAAPRVAIGVAGAMALAIGLVSLAGPPFWPAVFRWSRGPSAAETAAAARQL